MPRLHTVAVPPLLPVLDDDAPVLDDVAPLLDDVPVVDDDALVLDDALAFVPDDPVLPALLEAPPVEVEAVPLPPLL